MSRLLVQNDLLILSGKKKEFRQRNINQKHKKQPTHQSKVNEFNYSIKMSKAQSDVINTNQTAEDKVKIDKNLTLPNNVVNHHDYHS